MTKRRGFTMIEVLTVIAIIAILTAILLPVFNRARQVAKRDSDITKMGTIGAALKLYHNDNGGYPPLLLQAAEYNGAMRRAVYDLRRAYLYRARISDISTFASDLSSEKKDVTVAACWPNRDPNVNAGMPTEYQFGGPNQLVTYQQLRIDSLSLNGQQPTQPAELYAYDNYDLEPSLNPDCTTPSGQLTKYELRYILFWTVAGQLGGSPTDNQRQLGYPDPREDTIVTWNTFFQSTSGSPSIPTREKQTMVLYLGGGVRLVPGDAIYRQSWRFGQ